MRGPLLIAVGVVAALLLISVGWQWWFTPIPAPPLSFVGPASAPLATRPVVRKPTRPASMPAVSSPAKVLEAIGDLADSWRGSSASSAPADSAPSADRERAADVLLRKDYAAALAAFDRLLVRSPSDPQLLLGKALAFSGLKRYEDAVPLLEHALDRQPDNLIARFNLGVALMRSGQGTEAAGAFGAVLERNPADVRAKWNLAAVQQALGRQRAAIALWRELTEQKGNMVAKAPPGGGEGGMGRGGDVEAERRRDEETERRREGSKKTDPQLSTNDGQLTTEMPGDMLLDAWCHRGELAIALQLADEAELCFLKVLELDPRQAAAWCNLGIARSAAAKREKALTALDRALQLDPRMVAALNQCAMIHGTAFADTGSDVEQQRAIEFCQRSLAIAADQPNIRALRDTLRQMRPQSFGLHPAEAMEDPALGREGAPP